MERVPDLLSVPLEALTHAGHFMNPRSLLDASAACHHLRTALNENSVWRRHTRGGHISRLLEDATSIVQPIYTLPTLDSLDPLCDHRLHFSKQCRLLRNLRQGTYVKHCFGYSPYNPGFGDALYQFKTECFGLQQITYKSDYLFFADYDRDEMECVIKVYNIREDPQLVTTFSYKKDGDAMSTTVSVVGDKLVVMFEDWFQVYEINLPLGTFPPLYAMPTNESGDSYLSRHLVLNHFVVVVNHSRCALHMWDINTPEELVVIQPSDGLVDGMYLLHYNREEGLMLLCFELKDFTCQVQIYNVNVQKCTSFFVRLPFWDDYESDVGSGKVVIKLDDVLDVFDCESSSLIVQKAGITGSNPHIMNQTVVLACEDGVKVYDLSNLEMLYQLPPQEEGMISREANYIIVPGLANLIIMSCQKRVGEDILEIEQQVWDFDNKQMLFKLPSECNIINDSFSKFISVNLEGNIQILSFW